MKVNNPIPEHMRKFLICRKHLKNARYISWSTSLDKSGGVYLPKNGEFELSVNENNKYILVKGYLKTGIPYNLCCMDESGRLVPIINHYSKEELETPKQIHIFTPK